MSIQIFFGVFAVVFILVCLLGLAVLNDYLVYRGCRGGSGRSGGGGLRSERNKPL